MQNKEMRYVVEPTFTGDNSAESEYANIPQYFDFLYVKRDGTSLTYKEFMVCPRKSKQNIRFIPNSKHLTCLM